MTAKTETVAPNKAMTIQRSAFNHGERAVVAEDAAQAVAPPAGWAA
jgi:hypothetical protein